MHVASLTVNNTAYEVVAVYVPGSHTEIDYFDVFFGSECINEGNPFWEQPTEEDIAQFLRTKEHEVDISDKDCRISVKGESTWVRVGDIEIHISTGVARHPGCVVVETFNRREDPELEGEPMDSLVYTIKPDDAGNK